MENFKISLALSVFGLIMLTKSKCRHQTWWNITQGFKARCSLQNFDFCSSFLLNFQRHSKSCSQTMNELMNTASATMQRRPRIDSNVTYPVSTFFFKRRTCAVPIGRDVQMLAGFNCRVLPFPFQPYSHIC